MNQIRKTKLPESALGLAMIGMGALMLALPAHLFTQDTAVESHQSSPDPSQEERPQDHYRAMMLTSRAFRNAAKTIQPALVTIESYGGVGTSQGRIGGIRKQGEGNTTGVMISPDGYVLTSTFNFIQHPSVITVITSDGETRIAKLIGRDDTRKICLLKVEGVAQMPVPEMVDVDEITVGQWAVSLGVGYGDASPALSIGIISAKNRMGGRAIQTDANISPANYGGPLIDINGRMLGICVPMNPTSQAIGAGVEWYDSGIGFAIPLFDSRQLIQRLKNGEQISPAFIGIVSTPNPDQDGMLITKVLEGSPAATAGLLENDTLLTLDGKTVNDMLMLRQLLNRFESGKTIKVTIRRKQEPGKQSNVEQEFEILLGAPPQPKGELDRLKPPEIR